MEEFISILESELPLKEGQNIMNDKQSESIVHMVEKRCGSRSAVYSVNRYGHQKVI